MTEDNDDIEYRHLYIVVIFVVILNSDLPIRAIRGAASL